MLNWIRGKVSLKKKRLQEDEFDLDLSYIGPRIIAMGFPSCGLEGCYRNNLEDVKRYLDLKHLDHYWVFNLCAERKYPLSLFDNRASWYPFEDHNPPPLDMIRKFCFEAEWYYNKYESNVVVVHCKAGKGRTGLMICCLIMQMDLLPNSSSDFALKFFAKERTHNHKGVTIPSQIRYIKYYEEYLKQNPKKEQRFHEMKFRGANPLKIVLKNCPKHLLKSNIKIDFRNLKDTIVIDCKVSPMFDNTTIVFQLESYCIHLIGDIKLTVYLGSVPQFNIWFNTEYVKEREKFSKMEIDKAIKDPNIPPEFNMELYVKKFTNEKSNGFGTSRSQESVTQLQDKEVVIHNKVQEDYVLEETQIGQAENNMEKNLDIYVQDDKSDCESVNVPEADAKPKVYSDDLMLMDSDNSSLSESSFLSDSL